MTFQQMLLGRSGRSWGPAPGKASLVVRGGFSHTDRNSERPGGEMFEANYLPRVRANGKRAWADQRGVERLTTYRRR